MNTNSRYRKKPIEVNAVQWFGDGHSPYWASGWVKEHGDHFTVSTLEGVMRGEPGDWIIQGARKEVYPCKPDIFEMTYDKV